MFNNERESGIDLEYKINNDITLKLENGSTFIYINGIKFIQCMRLTINIPKKDITTYDEVDSIDEAAKLYTNQNVRGPMAAHVFNQKNEITPEQEFWGHCSNIQAWVEHDYDTRILMSNIAFPLLVELAKNGDLLANNVLKEEIALRLESGYPSVVHYLLEEGFLRFFTPSEFKTIIETAKLIENLVVNQYLFIEFLKYSGRFFPNLIKHVILKLVLLPNGANLLMSVIAKNSRIHLYKFDRKVLNSIKDDLKSFSNQASVQQSKGIEKAILRLEEYLSEEEEKKRRNQVLIDDTGSPMYKVIVFGDFNVGKTELLVKFVTDQYNDYTPPVGFSILKKQIELKKYNITANLMLWNVPGLSLSASSTIFQPFFKGANGMLLVFDVTRSKTFSNINNWYNTAVEYGLSGIPKILIGNKVDLKDERKIIQPMAEHLSQRLNASYYETSTLTGENIEEAFEKLAELMYIAPKRDDTSNNEPVISKNYKETSNDDNRFKKPLDWESKLILLKEIQPSSPVNDSAEKKNYTTPAVPSLKRKTINRLKEMDKREKRALDSVFKTFNKSTTEKSQAEFIVVFTSKYKFLTVFSILLVFVMVYMGLVPTMTIYIVPNFGMRVIVITLVIILFGMSGRILAFALYLRYYFIILASQGIYYKKIGKPRFISWTNIVRIGTKYRGGTAEVQTIILYLRSNKKVRFNSTYYLYKHKSVSFTDLFDLFKFH